MGGGYRKWYGNIVDVIDWSLEARTFYKENSAGRIIRQEFWNMQGITWGKIGSGVSSFRLLGAEQMYQETAILQENTDDTFPILGLLNSKPTDVFLKFLSPTMNFQLQDICAILILPMQSKILSSVNDLVNSNIALCKRDWNSFETSLDFAQHPLIELRMKSKERTNKENGNII